MQIDNSVQPIVKDTSDAESDFESGSQSDPNSYSGVSACNSEQQICDKNAKVVRKSSFLSSIMEVVDKHTYKSSRPMSAPSRSVSATLPSQSNGSGEKVVTQRQEPNEKLKRKFNIEEGARAALQYSAKHQNLHVKTMSLPRDHKLSHENGSNGLSSATSSPKRHLNTTSPSSRMRANIAGGEESCTFQNGEQWDGTKVETTNDCVCGVSGDSEPVDSGDGMKSNTVEEKDIFVSFQAPQSPTTLASVGQSKSPSDTNASFIVPFTASEETGRLRASSFSNKRKSHFRLNVLMYMYYLPLTEIDSLLQTLRSLSAHDEVEDLNILEGMIKSNTFRKAKHVCALL